MELGDQRQNLGHVLDTLVQLLERFVSFDVLVVVGVGLLGSHVSGLLDETVGIDLVPKSFLPCIELGVDQSDKIPIFLQVEEVHAAVIELLELRFGQIEESLQVTEFFALGLHDLGLLIVLVDLGVRRVNGVLVGTNGVVGAVSAEFLTEIVDAETEVTHGGFDVLSLLLLDRQDASLDGSKSLLGNIRQVSLDVLKNDKEILVGLHVHEMLLQEHDGLLHGLNAGNGVLSDHFHVTEVLHHFHKPVLLSLSLGALGQVLNAFLDFLNEVLDVADLRGSVLEQELSVLLNPIVDSGMELLNQLLRADLEPANVVVHFLTVNRVLHGVEEFNLLVEGLEIGGAGSNTVEHLLLEVGVAIHSVTHVVLHLFGVVRVVLGSALLDVDVLEVGALLEEGLERGFNLFLPEEVPLTVLVEERASLVSDLVKVVGDLLHSAEKLELILDFDQVVTSGGFLVVNTLNLDGNRDEIVNKLVDNIADARLTLVAADRWLECEFVIEQVDLDIEDGRPHVSEVQLDVDLVTQVLHARVDSGGDSLNDEAVDVVNVLEPYIALLVRLDVVHGVSQELVDLLALGTDIILTRLHGGSMELSDNLGLHGLLALEERL